MGHKMLKNVPFFKNKVVLGTSVKMNVLEKNCRWIRPQSKGTEEKFKSTTFEKLGRIIIKLLCISRGDSNMNVLLGPSF